MRLKLTAVTFGALMGCFFLVSRLSELNDDGMTLRGWVAAILSSAAAGALMGLLYVPVNRLLRKRGYSLHDDEDFDE